MILCPRATRRGAKWSIIDCRTVFSSHAIPFWWNMLLMKFLMHTQPFSIFHLSIFSSFEFLFKNRRNFSVLKLALATLVSRKTFRWSNPRRISNASSLLWLFLCVKTSLTLFRFVRDVKTKFDAGKSGGRRGENKQQQIRITSTTTVASFASCQWEFRKLKNYVYYENCFMKI